MGHTDTKTTEIYLQVVGEEKRQMVTDAWEGLARKLIFFLGKSYCISYKYKHETNRMEAKGASPT